MKSIQQIDTELNLKMDLFDRIDDKDKILKISHQNGVLDSINTILHILDAEDYLALSPDTRERLGSLGKDKGNDTH